MSEKQSFVSQVWAQLPPIENVSRESVNNSICELYDRGFTLRDAVRYALCWEEVDPSMNEEKALKRMKEIGQKYKSPREVLR